MTQRQKQKFEFRRIAGAVRASGRARQAAFQSSMTRRIASATASCRCALHQSKEEASLLLALPEGVHPRAAETERKSAFRVHFDDEYVGQNVANCDGIDLRSIRRRPFSLQSPPIVVKIPGDRQSHSNPPDARAPPPRIGTLAPSAFQSFPTESSHRAIGAAIAKMAELTTARTPHLQKGSESNKLNRRKRSRATRSALTHAVLAVAARRFKSGRSPTPVALD